MPWSLLILKTRQSLRNASTVPFHNTRHSHSQPVTWVTANQQTPVPEVGQPGVSAGMGAARWPVLGAGDMGQQELLRLTTAGQPIGFCAALAYPSPPWRTRGISSSWTAPEALHAAWYACGHSSHTKFFGMWSLELERLVIPISQLAECLQFLLQPTGTDDVEILPFLIYRWEMVVQSLKNLHRNWTLQQVQQTWTQCLNALLSENAHVTQFWVSVSVGGGWQL